jgi:SpoIID/LytB domain protein
MSSACPIEFLRAQCITARSWLLAMTEPKHADEPFDRATTTAASGTQGTDDLSDVAIDAVESTRGGVLVARDAMGEEVIVDANYSKSCGGIVEIPEHVWGIDKPGWATGGCAQASSARQFTR